MKAKQKVDPSIQKHPGEPVSACKTIKRRNQTIQSHMQANNAMHLPFMPRNGG
jgi:hypothetical protein